MDIFDEIISWSSKNSDADRAVAMKAYMKNNFEFYGISAPVRKKFAQEIRKKYALKPDDELWTLVELLWDCREREMQYLALDILTPLAGKLSEKNIPYLEKLLITKSWWDTVDSSAPNIIGPIFLKNNETKDHYAYKWMDSMNIWLQRSAIIFQLKYALKTDWNLLCEAILKNDMSKEFFVRKGQGWALRQYSKYHPKEVIQFVEANQQLSGLTKREALRLIKV